MFKILKEDLLQGLKAARDGASCPFLVNCLLGDKQYKGCAPCYILHFRKCLQSDAPALYYLIKTLSGYEQIVHDAQLMNCEGTQWQAQEAWEKFLDLVHFAETLLITLYPIFLANGGKFPLVPWQEMEKIKEEFSNAADDRFNEIAISVQQMNQEWCQWIMVSLSNTQDTAKYAKIAFLIINVVLEAMDKVLPVSEERRQELSKEIENFLLTHKKNAMA